MQRSLVLLAVTALAAACSKTQDGADAAPDAMPVVTIPVVSVTSSASSAATRNPDLDKARATYMELYSLLSRGIFIDPQNRAAGDANSKCQTIDGYRASLEPTQDPEVRMILDESKRVCAFDVPVLSANNTLRELTFAASQASHAMMCRFAAQDIAKARAAQPNSPRVRDLDVRYASICVPK